VCVCHCMSCVSCRVVSCDVRCVRTYCSLVEDDDEDEEGAEEEDDETGEEEAEDGAVERMSWVQSSTDGPCNSQKCASTNIGLSDALQGSSLLSVVAAAAAAGFSVAASFLAWHSATRGPRPALVGSLSLPFASFFVVLSLFSFSFSFVSSPVCTTCDEASMVAADVLGVAAALARFPSGSSSAAPPSVVSRMLDSSSSSFLISVTWLRSLCFGGELSIVPLCTSSEEGEWSDSTGSLKLVIGVPKQAPAMEVASSCRVVSCALELVLISSSEGRSAVAPSLPPIFIQITCRFFFSCPFRLPLRLSKQPSSRGSPSSLLDGWDRWLLFPFSFLSFSYNFSFLFHFETICQTQKLLSSFLLFEAPRQWGIPSTSKLAFNIETKRNTQTQR